MKAIHVASVPLQLDLAVLDKVLGGLESMLVDLGADRVWVDVDESALAVMAELPDGPAREPQRAATRDVRSW